MEATWGHASPCMNGRSSGCFVFWWRCWFWKLCTWACSTPRLTSRTCFPTISERRGRHNRDMKIASWNVNSIRARIDHVTEWLKLHQPDVLLMQELKATEFPTLVFQALGYESVAVMQKSYNGVAVLSRHPMETINTTLAGDEADSHARYLEMTIEGIRMVNIYLPNGNPVGSEKFLYKLAWMDRLINKMSAWRREGLPALI